MWKPTNQPATPSARPNEPERTPVSTPPVTSASEPVAAAARPVVASATADQATIGKSLVIKGEVTGSESLYIDGRVEGSINLAGNRVTVGRNGVVSANINAREIVVLGKVRGNLTASDRVDIRSDGSLTRTEARRSLNTLSSIRQRESRMRDYNGRLDRRETAFILSQLDRLSERVRFQMNS